MKKINNLKKFWIDKDYKIKNNKLIIGKKLFDQLHNKNLWNIEGLGHKKIGGSSLGVWTGSNKFQTMLDEMLRINRLAPPILERKYLDAGIKFEPLIIDWLKTKIPFKIETFDPQEINYDYFKKTKNFGGIPDGLIKRFSIITNNEVLEIKTTHIKNKKYWEKEAPKSYVEQLKFYMTLDYSQYIRGHSTQRQDLKNFLYDNYSKKLDEKPLKGAIVAYFLNDEDYKTLNPTLDFKNLKSRIKIFKYEIKSKEFDQIINQLQKIQSGYYLLLNNNEVDISKAKPMVKEWLFLKDNDELTKWYNKWKPS